MATWWELMIPIGGTLLGAFMGSWTQGRNGLRTLRAQNVEAEKAREHAQAMKLLDDKRQMYAFFVMTANKTLDSQGDNEKYEVWAAKVDNFVEAYHALFFLASPEVLAVADEIYSAITEASEEPLGPLINYFIKVARKELGIGGVIPPAWTDLA